MRPIPMSWLALGGLLALACAHAAESGPDGVTVERVQAPASAHVRVSPTVTLVTVDPGLHELDLLTQQETGRARTLDAWAAEFGLTGVINASMHLPNGRSAGFMQDGDRINNGQDNPAYGGFLAFQPRDPADAPVVLVGRDCEGFDLADLRARYAVVLQGYRLLDCDGGAMAWADPKLYSAAALAVDTAGNLVLVHTGGAWRMSEFATWLATRSLVGAIFVEGGPEAGLYVDLGRDAVREIGTYAGMPRPARFRDVPNVVGFRPRR